MNEAQILDQQSGQTVQPEVNPSEAGQDTNNQATQTYVTTEQLNAAKREILSQAQSLVDKKGNAINAKIAQLESFGIKATPEQARAMIEKEEAEQSSVNPQQAAQPNANSGHVDREQAEWIVASTGNAEAANDPSWQSVYQISKEAGGMVIEKDDPEFEIMNKQFTSGAAFVAAFAQAIALKKLRESDNTKNGYAATPALFSSGQKSNAVPDDIDPKSLYSQVF